MRSLMTVLKAGAASMVTDFKPVSSTMYGWLREANSGDWQRNIVTESQTGLMSSSAIYACTTRISNDIAKLAPQLQELQQTKVWDLAPDNSPFWITLRKPNHFQNSIQFIRSWALSRLIWGNTYVLKARDNRNMVSALYVLDPRRVTPLVTPDGDVYYSLGSDDLAGKHTGATVPASEIIHDRGATFWHPLVGVPPLFASALSGTLGLRIQANSQRFFENMSRPSGLLTSPGTITEITAERLRKDWEQNYSGQNIGRLAIMGDGLKYEAMTIPAEQAQLAAQLELSIADVARSFGMPLYKIGAGPMPTSNNVEALNLQYYSDCLQSYIEDVEACWDEGIGLDSTHKVQLDLEGLLRMDSAAKVDKLMKAGGGAYMTPNEVRLRDGLPPKAGGNAIYKQHQDYSIEALAKRDAREDPFGTAAPEPKPEPEPEPADEETIDEDAREEAAKAAQRAADADRKADEAITKAQAASDALTAASAVERVTKEAEQRAMSAAEATATAANERAERAEREAAAAAEQVRKLIERVESIEKASIAAVREAPEELDIEALGDCFTRQLAELDV